VLTGHILGGPFAVLKAGRICDYSLVLLNSSGALNRLDRIFGTLQGWGQVASRTGRAISPDDLPAFD
jgi:hypothetical protein